LESLINNACSKQYRVRDLGVEQVPCSDSPNGDGHMAMVMGAAKGADWKQGRVGTHGSRNRPIRNTC
ncbi:MAG: hypothetical protein ACODAD_05685, partial [Planctomycetota bacterium]